MDSPFGPSVLPRVNPRSAWQRSVLDDPLFTWGQHDTLPETADLVIIGSGLSGARIAHSLLMSPSPPSNIVVVEAREITSGASGRNAGHCRPDAYRGYNVYSAKVGPAQAKKVLESEAITLQNVAAFVKEHNVECEFTPRPTVDVCMATDFEQYARKAYQDAKAGGVNVDHVKILSGPEAKKFCRTELATMAYQWDAATLNPIKLAYSIWRQCLKHDGFKLFSYAPVTSVTENEGALPWLVSTTRGSIATSKVVYATNAYSSLILPQLKDYIWPCRSQAVQLSVPPSGEKFPRLEPSYSLRYDLHNFYSVAQRPSNQVVLAAPRRFPGMSQEDFDGLFDMNDSDPVVLRSRNAFEHFTKVFPEAGYGPSTLEPGVGGFDFHWAGIIALTGDMLPFVGPLPGKEGQYVMAGFNGHGMARIFHCGPCLADVILHGMSHWDPTVPECFQLTPERLEKLAAKTPQEGSAADKAKATAFGF